MAENGGARTETVSQWKVNWMSAFPWILGALVLVISIALGVRAPEASMKQLTVVGSLVPAGDHLEISGRVLQDGDAVAKALVWGVVQYANGQHASPASTQTDEKGWFLISPVPSTLGTGNHQVAEAIIHARKEKPGGWLESATTLRGEDKVRAAGASALEASEVVGLSPFILAPLLAIFLLSAMLPFFGQETYAKYLAAVVLAFSVTACMILYIALGLRYVITEGKSKEILQLGFASIYKSTYVKDVQPEWVVSFTAAPRKPEETVSSAPTFAPSEAISQTAAPRTGTGTSTPGSAVPQAASQTTASNPGTATTAGQPGGTPASSVQSNDVVIDHGFGAPLWVLLVSVLGSGVLTVGLIVDEITNAGEITKLPLEGQPDEIRKHVYSIVQHQFFILFAPVTAIFVYQTMVAGSAATSAYTVGLAALGAGPALSALLTKAGAAATKLFGTSPSTP